MPRAPFRTMVLAGSILFGSTHALSAIDRHRQIEALEQDIATKLASGAIKIPGGPRDISRYARFYQFESDVAVRAVFSRPVASVNTPPQDFKPGYYLVDKPQGFQVGGNCDTTIHVRVEDIRALKYSLRCAAR